MTRLQFHLVAAAGVLLLATPSLLPWRAGAG
jgi:hypothetical protein